MMMMTTKWNPSWCGSQNNSPACRNGMKDKDRDTWLQCRRSINDEKRVFGCKLQSSCRQGSGGSIFVCFGRRHDSSGHVTDKSRRGSCITPWSRDATSYDGLTTSGLPTTIKPSRARADRRRRWTTAEGARHAHWSRQRVDGVINHTKSRRWLAQCKRNVRRQSGKRHTVTCNEHNYQLN